MPRLSIDLGDVEDLQQALSIIQGRLAELGTPAPSPLQQDVPPEVAKRVVDDLWGRIGSDRTWEFLRSFAEIEGAVSLSQVAAHLRVPADDIRARKFRFGRTENAVNEWYSIELLPKVWRDDEYVYEMPETIRREILSRN